MIVIVVYIYAMFLNGFKPKYIMGLLPKYIYNKNISIFFLMYIKNYLLNFYNFSHSHIHIN